MNTYLTRLAMPAALLAALTFMVGCGETFRVVDTGPTHMTVSNDEGTDIETLDVAPDADITLDGQPTTLEQINPGDTVYVSLEDRDGMEVATTIRASTTEESEAAQTEVVPMEPSTVPSDSEPVIPHETEVLENDESPSSNHLPESTEPAESDLPNENAIDSEDENAIDPDADILLPETTEPAADVPSETPDIDDAVPSDPEDGAPVEAEPDDADAAMDTFEGTIASVTAVENKFVMRDADGNEHTFMVNDETTFTLDGTDSAFGDLKADHKVKVTANHEGESFVAMTVEATSS